MAALRALMVDPGARRRGIGTLLIERCIEFARAAGYARMELGTTSDLVEARRLYEAAGFRIVYEEREPRFGTAVTSQRMALEPDPSAREHPARRPEPAQVAARAQATRGRES